jgi:hypothetical protein
MSRGLLIFPETQSLELVRAVTGGELSLEEPIEDLKRSLNLDRAGSAL